jgi:hypothetical protein
VDSFVDAVAILARNVDCSGTGGESCNGIEDIETISRNAFPLFRMLQGRRSRPPRRYMQLPGRVGMTFQFF